MSISSHGHYSYLLCEGSSSLALLVHLENKQNHACPHRREHPMSKATGLLLNVGFPSSGILGAPMHAMVRGSIPGGGPDVRHLSQPCTSPWSKTKQAKWLPGTRRINKLSLFDLFLPFIWRQQVGGWLQSHRDPVRSWNLLEGSSTDQLDTCFPKNKRYSCAEADVWIRSALHLSQHSLIITTCQCLLRTAYIYFLNLGRKNIHGGHDFWGSTWRLSESSTLHYLNGTTGKSFFFFFFCIGKIQESHHLQGNWSLFLEYSKCTV